MTILSTQLYNDSGQTSTNDSSSTVGYILQTVAQFFVTFGGLVKQGTKHMDWNTANAKAQAIAQQLTQYVKSLGNLTQYNSISEIYRQKMIHLVQSGIRWGENYPQPNSSVVAYLQNEPSQSNYAGVYTITWIWVMWALQNSDLESADEFRLIEQNDINATLIPSINQVLGAGTAKSFTLSPVSTSSNQQGQGTVSNAGIVSLPLSNMWTLIIVIGVIVGLFWMKKKGAL